jgi:hypothetical protein
LHIHTRPGQGSYEQNAQGPSHDQSSAVSPLFFER